MYASLDINRTIEIRGGILHRNLKIETVNRMIRSLAFIAFALVSATCLAGNTPAANNTEIRKEVSRAIGYPSALSNSHDTEMVLVSFEVEPCGMITILETNSSNKEFETYVLNKLQGMHFDASEGAFLNMKFTFTPKG